MHLHGWLYIAVASMAKAYCLWKDHMKLIRISGVIVGILYGTYYIYYGSTFMIIGYMLILLTSIYALLKERKNNNEDLYCKTWTNKM